jgi:hypothetical protein
MRGSTCGRRRNRARRRRVGVAMRDFCHRHGAACGGTKSVQRKTASVYHQLRKRAAFFAPVDIHPGNRCPSRCSLRTRQIRASGSGYPRGRHSPARASAHHVQLEDGASPGAGSLGSETMDGTSLPPFHCLKQHRKGGGGRGTDGDHSGSLTSTMPG